MRKTPFVKAGILTVVVLLSFVLTWELHLRHKGYSVSYDDSEALWAHTRSKVYQSPDQATVFIGSSRIKFDLDIPTWEQLTGLQAVQLALVGSSPLPVLDNLAEDKRFRGNLVVDVTEGLFFSSAPANRNSPEEKLAFYKKLTPAQRVSFPIDQFLQSDLVFLDRDFFSLNALLRHLPVKDRPGIYGGPDFPWEFDKTMATRQSVMDDRFVHDTSLQNRVKAIWAGFAKMNTTPPAAGAQLDSFLLVVKKDVDRIRSRGGRVLFVRTPSSGPYWAGEQKAFPRHQYWDRLLATTGCPGIHFKDDPATAGFVCPEWSHLQPRDAVVFTQNFVRLLKEKGWELSPRPIAYLSHHTKTQNHAF